MLLLFSYVSYLISPNSNTSFTVHYPWLCFFLYPIFLFFILKHVLYLFGQIRINPPFPPEKSKILTYVLHESVDLSKIKAGITNKIVNDERFKDFKRTIKNNFFISYSFPAPLFFADHHIQLIEAPFERDVTLYQFIELNLMGLFENSENEPNWKIFLLKIENRPVLVFRFSSEYAFSYEFVLKLLSDQNFPIKKAMKLEENNHEWRFTKNFRLMKRLMEIKPKENSSETGSNFLMFLKGMMQGKPQKDLDVIKKQVLFSETNIDELLQDNKIWNEDQGFLNEKEVDFMFDIFKLAGLFIPHALMIKAFLTLEKKYQRMGYAANINFYKELPGLVKKIYFIDWKEQMFSVGLCSQVYAGNPCVVVIKNENLKKNKSAFM